MLTKSQLEHDQRLNATLNRHLDIPFKALPVIVRVHHDRQQA